MPASGYGQTSLQQVPPEIKCHGAKFLELKCADPVDRDVSVVVDAEETDVSAIPRGGSVTGQSHGSMQ